MKTFDEFYEELENSNNNSELIKLWKEAQKENKKVNKITVIICSIIDVLFLLNIINSEKSFLLLYKIMFILIINLMIFLVIKVIFSKSNNKYIIQYKKIVINKIMNNFYNNLEYFPNKPMPEYIYKEVNYNEYYNRYESEDYLEAQINNKYSIQMAEIKTEEEEKYTDSQGKTQTRTTTKFYGLFAKIVMNKSIQGQLQIMQNGKLVFDNRLKMDSSEFEKYFDVKASNKIVGMQLLTSDVMEDLLEFQNNTNMKYDVFIKDNYLYLRFHSGEMFEVRNLKNGALNRELVEKYFYMLNFTYNLSNKLINIINDTQI